MNAKNDKAKKDSDAAKAAQPIEGHELPGDKLGMTEDLD